METIGININGLSVSYDRKRVLTNIYMNLEPGKVYGVIGPNGAGKSTLFKAILGLVEPSSGSIEITGGTARDLRRKMAYVPQRDEVDWQFPATVMDVVLMGRYPHKRVFQRINASDKSIARKALTDLGIEHLSDRQIGELSGGQQQRVFLARALCQEPLLYLMDEPFVGVDMTTEDRIIRILRKEASKGKLLLVVHHDLSTVEQYFDRVILLNQRLVAFGETRTTFTEENIAKAYGAQLTILHKTGILEK